MSLLDRGDEVDVFRKAPAQDPSCTPKCLDHDLIGGGSLTDVIAKYTHINDCKGFQTWYRCCLTGY